MANQFNVLGISGSLRRGSYNSSLLKNARILSPGKIRIQIQSLKEIPLYDDDLIPVSIPDPVLGFRNLVLRADAIIIACPEYNYSLSGVLKNALDWLSTNAITNVMDGKLVALMGASKTGFGTVRAQLHLRQILYAMNAHVLSRPEVHLSKAGDFISSNGEITDKKILGQIQRLLSELERKLSGNTTGV